jgi:hypothetical protein
MFDFWLVKRIADPFRAGSREFTNYKLYSQSVLCTNVI